MLTLRPVMLHLTKSILNAETTFAQTTKDFQQLSCTCIEAARRSIELLMVAKKEDMIAKFGFFDLDTMFSAGFIMLLAAIIEAASPEHSASMVPFKSSPSILEAITLLDYLGTFNNEAAIQRRDQIQKLYDRIPSLVRQPHPSEVSITSEGNHRHNALAEGIHAPVYPDESHQGIGRVPQSPNITDNTGIEGWTVNSLPLQLPDDPQRMYTLYHNDDFTLTGGDVADFEELERHLFGNGG
ncbi:hypothetical protein VI817_001891 [Penicillium citrinum]|nr:hypothetical protein VI817_001891 [Penicillium citrinum]